MLQKFTNHFWSGTLDELCEVLALAHDTTPIFTSSSMAKLGLSRSNPTSQICQCICWNTIEQQCRCNWTFGIKHNCTTKLKNNVDYFQWLPFICHKCSIRSLSSLKWMFKIFYGLMFCMDGAKDNLHCWMPTFHDVQVLKKTMVHLKWCQKNFTS